MEFKTKLFGLGAALALGLSVVSPALATTADQVDVSVTVQNSGTGAISFAVASGADTDFGIVPVNAAGNSATGLVHAGEVQFDIVISGDDKLFRSGGDVNVKLGDGSDGNAFLDLTGGDPTGFYNAGTVDFQIPGRYLSVDGLQNPQQAKFTGGTGTPPGGGYPIWSGLDNNSTTPGDAGRAPRVAGAGNSPTSAGKAIYKVGDIGGTFNNNSNACHITTDSVVVDWNSACGDASFSEGNVTKQIAYILPGSGFVEANQTIKLSLDVPAGVYPGTYTGILTLESTLS